MSWFDSVTGFVSNTAHSAYSGVSSAASSAYQFGSNVTATASRGINAAQHAVEGVVDSAVDGVGNGARALAHTVEGVPVLGTAAHYGAEGVAQLAQVPGGVLHGATHLLGSAANAVVHPLDTARASAELASHIPVLGAPINAVREINEVAHGRHSITEGLNRTFNPAATAQEDGAFFARMGRGLAQPYIEDYQHGRYGQMLGRGVFDVGSLLLTGGESAAARAGGEGAVLAADATRAAGAAADVTRAAGATADATRAAGAAADATRAAGATADATRAAGATADATRAAGAGSDATRAAGAAGDTRVVQMPAVTAEQVASRGGVAPPHFQATPVGTPRPVNPVQQMTTVNPADIARGTPPPGFQSGQVGSFRVPNGPQQMPAVPAGIRPGAPQPVGWNPRPVGGGLPAEAGAVPRAPVASAPPVAPAPGIGTSPTLPQFPSHTPTVPGVGPAPGIGTSPTLPQFPSHTPTVPGVGPAPGIGTSPTLPQFPSHTPTVPGVGPAPGIGTSPTLPQFPSRTPTVPGHGPGVPDIGTSPTLPQFPSRTPTVPGHGPGSASGAPAVHGPPAAPPVTGPLDPGRLPMPPSGPSDIVMNVFAQLIHEGDLGAAMDWLRGHGGSI